MATRIARTIEDIFRLSQKYLYLRTEKLKAERDFKAASDPVRKWLSAKDDDGTWVNGVRVPHAELRPGTILTVGGTRLRGATWEFVAHVTNGETGEVWVEVYRSTGSPTCTSFTISVSN